MSELTSLRMLRRVAMISMHTCPLALLGGKKSGGMNVYVRDLSRELSRRGIQVDVFTRSQDPCQPRVCHELGPCGRVVHVPAGPERFLPPDALIPHVDPFIQGVLAFAQAEGARYQVIHSHYWLSGRVAEALRAVWHVPVVHMFHTLGHMKNQIARTPQERAPAARLEGERRVVAMADRLIAATPLERRQLVEHYGAEPTRIRVIPPGVDLHHFHPIPPAEAKRRVGIPCGDRSILFVGRIEPLKGIDTLLQALSILRDRWPHALEHTCLVIIGGDPWSQNPDEEMARLQSMRAELGLADLVAFIGAKGHDVLPFYYAAASVVVVPSYYESFGMVALEAMAVGTPVIASDVGGLSYLVQHGITGFRVPRRSPEALAERLLALLTDEALRRQMGHQAREYARLYAWPRIADRILGVYGEVLAPLARLEAFRAVSAPESDGEETRIPRSARAWDTSSPGT